MRNFLTVGVCVLAVSALLVVSTAQAERIVDLFPQVMAPINGNPGDNGWNQAVNEPTLAIGAQSQGENCATSGDDGLTVKMDFGVVRQFTALDLACGSSFGTGDNKFLNFSLWAGVSQAMTDFTVTSGTQNMSSLGAAKLFVDNYAGGNWYTQYSLDASPISSRYIILQFVPGTTNHNTYPSVNEIALEANPVPEPSTLILLGTGLLGLLAYAWRRRRA